MSEIPPSASDRAELPDVDERLVAPGSGYEIIDGQVVYVPPADEPHGTSHVSLAAIVKAHIAEGFTAAVDMLTRTSRIDDIAPDVSVFPSARTAKGGRQLEVIAFEIASTQALSDVADKARRLSGRGVRRVFALDLGRRRALEWSRELGTWSILGLDGTIVDEAFAVPLRIAPLLDAALGDDSIVQAWRTRRHRAFEEERAEGHREGHREGLRAGHQDVILELLEARGISVEAEDVARIRGEADLEILHQWRTRAKHVVAIADLFVAD
jgi:Uma2 family endonuclease